MGPHYIPQLEKIAGYYRLFSMRVAFLPKIWLFEWPWFLKVELRGSYRKKGHFYLKLIEFQYWKWPYFFYFQPLSLRNGKKAKIKATALGPLYLTFWFIFLASRRDFGKTHHQQKFHQFLWTLSAKNWHWADFWGEVPQIFRQFFIFWP